MNTEPLGSLNRIIIYSGDTITCASFFKDFFGFQPIGEWSTDWAELNCGGCRLAFHQAYGLDGPITAPTGSPFNPHKIVFTVSDVYQARQRLIQQGVEVGEVEILDDTSGLIACQGVDPEGHVYQICNR